MLKQWRTICNTVKIWLVRDLNTRPPALNEPRLLTAQSSRSLEIFLALLMQLLYFQSSGIYWRFRPVHKSFTSDKTHLLKWQPMNIRQLLQYVCYFSIVP